MIITGIKEETLATTTASRKAKGRNLQKTVASAILTAFPELTENDVKSTPMGSSGSDVWLSEAALRLFNYDVECKAVEKLNIWEAIEQSKARTVSLLGRKNLVVFKKNRTAPYVALSLTDFIELIRERR